MVKLFIVAVCALVLFVHSNARNMPTTTLSAKTPTTVDVATTVRTGVAGFKEEKVNFLPFSGVGLATDLGEDIGVSGVDGADGADGGVGGTGGGTGGGAGGAGGLGSLGGDVVAVKGGEIGAGIIDP